LDEEELNLDDQELDDALEDNVEEDDDTEQEEDDSLEDNVEEEDGEEAEEESTDKEDSDEEKIARIARELEGKSPEEIAKQILHEQRLISRKAEEAKTNQVALDRVLNRIEELQTQITSSKDTDTEEEDEYPAFPKDENGVAVAPKDYWVKTYFPYVYKTLLESYLESGEDEDLAKEQARLSAREKVEEEMERYKEYRKSKTDSVLSTQESSILEDAKRQEDVIESEKKKYGSLAARLGYDPGKSAEVVLRIATEMVKNAYNEKDPAKRITTEQAAKPETAVIAMRQAWDFVLANEARFSSEMKDEPKTVGTRQTPGSQTRSTASKPVKKSVNLPERHIRFCEMMKVDPVEYAEQYGVLR